MLVLSKDPVLRYQVSTKKIKTSQYQVSLSTGGTEYPVNPVLSARSERCADVLSLHKSTEPGRHQKEEMHQTIKHFKDRHPDQMKEFKQVSFNLIFRSLL